jgi:hypothetical protein
MTCRLTVARSIWLMVAVAALACGGRIDDPETFSPATGGVSSTVGGTAVGGASGAVGGTAGTSNSAPVSGLVPLSDSDLQQILATSCSESSLLPGTSDASTSGCRFAPPQISSGCGGQRDATADELNVVLTYSEIEKYAAVRVGSLMRATSTSSDCPLGDGFYFDSASSEFVLCPLTCARLELNPGSTVEIYVRCGIVALCIN